MSRPGNARARLTARYAIHARYSVAEQTSFPPPFECLFCEPSTQTVVAPPCKTKIISS